MSNDTETQPVPHTPPQSPAEPGRAASAPLTSFYACYQGCEVRYPLDEVHYRCGRCQGLLDVRHDWTALRARPAATWRALFDSRRSAPAPWFLQSGVWSKREWVCPQIEDQHVISLGEGYSPLVPVPGLGRDLAAAGGASAEFWVKQCGQSHTGSFKDLGMTVLVSMVQQMRALGRRIPAVACASTGDTSAALAAYAARAGIPALVFLPAGKITDEQLLQPIANFAVTVSFDTDFDGCMRLVAQFCERHGVYLANSMNPLRMEGQKTVSVEICQQLGWQVPDWVVVPGGNLGHVTALGKGWELLRELGLIDRLPRLCVAQAAHASPLHQAYLRDWRYEAVTARATQASAIQIGAPVNVHKAIDTLRRFDGVVGAASEDEIAHACMLGDRRGLYTDPHTGVALAVAGKLLAAGTIKPGQQVVVVSTAHGLKFGGFKRAYHLGLGRTGPTAEVTSRQPNRPISLPALLEAAEAALLPLLSSGAGGAGA